MYMQIGLRWYVYLRKSLHCKTYIIYRSDSMKRITIAIVVALFAFTSFAQGENGTSNEGGVLNELSIT